MDVFISWSGPLSHGLALALRDWLPNVIQAVRPYVSSEDIAKGRRWPQELGDKLETVRYGIICLTPDNATSQWIHFEAGALGKSLADSLVAPVLLGLARSEVGWPLAQFQLTEFARDDIRRMVGSINEVGPEPLAPDRLDTAFERFWPDLEERGAGLVEADGGGVPRPPLRSDAALLEEVLELAREQQRVFNRMLGDGRWAFRGNAKLDPLSSGDYRQLALGLEMLKCLADIERLGAYQPPDAVVKTLMRLRDPLEVILARAYAPRIHSVYFVENGDGTWGVTFQEDDAGSDVSSGRTSTERHDPLKDGVDDDEVDADAGPLW